MTTTFNSVSDLLANNSQSTEKPDKTKADSTMFMTLLVAQLKNQDPLAPQDGAAFVAQLAQFNSLEQLTGIKQSIDKLVTQMQ
jgi:flagellar basal-body rod modification protein FlgD